MAGKGNSSGLAKTLALLLGIASMGLAGFAVWIMLAPGQGKGTRVVSSSVAPAATPAADAPKGPWAASAPGRVEPRNGQVRLSPVSMGRVTAIPAKLNDKVNDGHLLLVMDDKDARARLHAAEAQVAAARKDRDAAPVTAGRENINRAEDNLYAAERALTNARIDLDDAILADPRGTSAAATSARRRISEATDRVRQETANHASVVRSNPPLPSRLDAGVSAARGEVMMADMALDRTRIRAPSAGTVLQINTRVGEMLAPSPEQVVIVMGDISKLRVRAEVDEADIPKIRNGQSVFVKTSAYPNQEFEGKVAELASSLIIPRMGARGPRRATDVEVLEVLIDLDGASAEGGSRVLPGMRVDVYFR